MPRLFTGLEIPEDVAMGLDLMRGGLRGARWIDRENYHITLRFMGDIPDHVAREVAQGLDGLSFRPFGLRLKGVGYFGGKDPHTLYASIEESPEIRRLQAAQERLCQMIGLAPEARRYTPHVTLARLRDADPREVESYVAHHNLYRSRLFELQHFVLFSSRPSRGGGPYAVEEVYGSGLALAG